MPVDLAVIVPTRGRPENIRKVIAAWDFTNAWDVANLVLAVDADDSKIDDYRKVWTEFDSTLPDDILANPIRMITFPEWQPMVHKLNAAAVMLADEGDYFALGFAGDDHLPQTINWAQTYLAELRALGTGMVYGDDGFQGKKLSTEWAVTTDVVRALGRMVPADVEHMYCDNSIMEMFGQAGARKFLPAVRIEHFNPYANRKAPMDDQYRRVNSREQYRRDGKAYRLWQDRKMAIDVAVIKALRPGRAVKPTRQRSRPSMGRFPFPPSFKQIKQVTPNEIALTLADLAIGVPPDQEIVEIGVYHGRTTLILAWGARQGRGAHVTGIDPWDLAGNVYGDELGDMAGARSWARYWVNSLAYSNYVTLIRGFSRAVAEQWVKPVGMLFIDGDHTEQGARQDIESWIPHLTPDAVIAIDDYVSPDYPGVAKAIDDLVSEGVLAPVEVYHDRLGVTRLKEKEGASPTALTSEGVSPSPYPAAPGQVAVEEPPNRAELEAEWRKVDPEGVTALEASAANLDAEMSRRVTVQEDELIDVEPGTPIGELNLVNLKALAKARGIVLGIRKDKRDAILQALREGQ